MLASCGGDDGGGDDGGGDDGSDPPASEAGAGNGDGGLTDDERAELEELGLSDDEIAEAEEMLGASGDGFAEVIVDGEPLVVRSTSCGVIPGGEQVRLEANLEPGFSYFQIRFGEDWSSDERTYDFDSADSATLWIDRDEYAVEFNSFGSVGDVVAWGDERHATGTAVLVPQGERAEAENPDPQFVEFTIACDDDVRVRPQPDGIVPLVPPGEEDEEPEEEAEEVLLLDPADGWSDDLAAIEVPELPGTGVAVVNGTRVELLVECRGGPRVEEPAEGEVFRFDLFAADVEGQTIGFEIRRAVGSGVGGQRLAEEERLYVFTEGGVGALGWQTLPTGEVLEPRNYGQAAERIVHVAPTGVVTVTAEVTQPLQGDFDPVTLELGARCDETWDG